eukprot:TRINITY_DN16916_c0_g1_i2.p1 TRINITY_DN16916_c0_g1~~TRINITY_DN16916_c0_g1_i2.p1  ORF type:complete len:211 (+),score=36.10 TRINITY_DN16916_c0_g1_i2:57-689(+)
MGCGGSRSVSAPSPRAHPEGDYKVILRRVSGAEVIGLQVAAMSNQMFRIKHVKPEGLIPAWNEEHENMPERLVKVGDVILEVNGVFGDVHAMARQFRERTVAFKLRRRTGTNPAEDSEVARGRAAADEPEAEPAALSSPTHQEVAAAEESHDDTDEHAPDAALACRRCDLLTTMEKTSDNLNALDMGVEDVELMPNDAGDDDIFCKACTC